MAKYLFFKNDCGYNAAYSGFDSEEELRDFLKWDETPIWRGPINSCGLRVQAVLGFDTDAKVFELTGDPEVMECPWLLSKSAYWANMVILETENIGALDALADRILELRKSIVKIDPETWELYISRMALMFSDNGSTTIADDYRAISANLNAKVKFIKHHSPNDGYLQLIDELESDVA